MTTLTDSHFDTIQQLAQDLWGLELTERKRSLVDNRLTKFIRDSRFADVREFVQHLETEADDEDRLVFFDILSTNVTSFFREQHHFDYLEREFYTPLARGNLTRPGRRIRMWSAACSTGPEPYSMAIQAIEQLPELKRWDFKILATDLSNSALASARRGVYPRSMVAQLDEELVRRHFLRGTGANAANVKVAPHVRELVTIGRQNLMEPWSFKGPVDVIFCRNVMIYFDRSTRERLVRRLLKLLAPDGVLAIGSAETLSGLDVPVQCVQPSVYVKQG